MNAIEKGVGIFTLIAGAFAIGVGWNSLSNRIEQVDSKVASIQELLGSTTCTAILTRQIEAIEKGKAEARQALEALSSQYGCVPTRDTPTADYNMGEAYNMSAAVVNDAALANELEAVDALLNEQE